MVFGPPQTDQPRAGRVFGRERHTLNQARTCGFWGLSNHYRAQAQEFVVDQPGPQQ